MTERYPFDDEAKESAQHLLEQFWILRKREPDKYHRIRERQKALRRFFSEKFGFRFIVHREFAKLEKIPVEPHAWMGIQPFQSPRDYALLCCLLAFLEKKNVDEQFLLSEICAELEDDFPPNDELDWTQYEHRKSLVRMLKFATEQGLLHVVDGRIDDFQHSQESEVLYEGTTISRYFMRAYPRDLFEYDSMQDILNTEWEDRDNVHVGEARRQRIYRKLFLTPGVSRQGADDSDFVYLRRYRNRIRDDVEKHSEWQFELYKNTALLTATEPSARFHLYPDQKAISDIALQFAAEWRAERQKEEIPWQHDGTLRLSRVDFDERVERCRERYGHGWSKQYREALLSRVSEDLLDVFAEWNMIAVEEETNMLIVYPLLARVTGQYPHDFEAHGDGQKEGDAHGRTENKDE